MKMKPRKGSAFEFWEKKRLRLEKIERKLREEEEEKERKIIEKQNKVQEIKRLNNLVIGEFCIRNKYTQTTNNIHGILSKTEIEILVRGAYKSHKNIVDDGYFYLIDRDRVDPFTVPQLIHFEDIDKIALLERYLMATPQIYKLEDLREYLKGDRKNKKILSVFINAFDECNFSIMQHSYHFYKDLHLFYVIQHLLRDRVLLISYIDKLKNSNSNKKLTLQWNLNETQIIYLYNQFIDKEIIHKNIGLGLFYQIFNNQVADFKTPIQINPKILACFLFWSKRKNILLNKQPFKIIESLKMFCNTETEGKPVTAHNLNRYVSENNIEFIECSKPVFEKIKEIMDNL